MPINISGLSLRDIEYLVAVAEQRHFGKAAASCHVSQPALSAQIKKLEDFLGVQVFERTKRQVMVTSRGERLLEQARVVVAEARKLVELAAHKAEPLSGPFRLGVIATLSPYLMPFVLKPLRHKFPQIELSIREGLTADLLDELKAGRLDAVLASDTFSSEGFRTLELFFEPFLLAVAKDHPLAVKKDLKTRDLDPTEMVLLEEGHCLKDQALGLCPANRRGQHRQFHATSVETLRHLVAAGQGYTLIPALAAGGDSPLKELIRYRKLEGARVGRTVILAARERASNEFDTLELAEFFVKNRPPGTLAIG